MEHISGDTLFMVVVNAAVTWGTIRTTLNWLRRDVDRAHARLDAHDALLLRRSTDRGET